jgi:hypothetical protein
MFLGYKYNASERVRVFVRLKCLLTGGTISDTLNNIHSTKHGWYLSLPFSCNSTFTAAFTNYFKVKEREKREDNEDIMIE